MLNTADPGDLSWIANLPPPSDRDRAIAKTWEQMRNHEPPSLDKQIEEIQSWKKGQQQQVEEALRKSRAPSPPSSSPSTGSPPPTVGNYARPSTTPRPASPPPVDFAEPPPRISLPPIDAPPPPASAPTSAIKGALPGVAAGAAIDIGLRIASGQSPAHAVGGGLASTAGALAGGALGGALGGPAGAWIGAGIGGAVGGALFDKLFPPSADGQQNGQPPERDGPLPFTGGQGVGVRYYVDYVIIGGNNDPGVRSVEIAGPILFIGWVTTRPDPPVSQELRVVSGIFDAQGNVSGNTYYVLGAKAEREIGGYDTKVVGVRRVDGRPDTDGNPAPLPIPEDNRSPDSKRGGALGIGPGFSAGARIPDNRPSDQRGPTPSVNPAPQPAPPPSATSGPSPTPYDNPAINPSSRPGGMASPTPTYWPGATPSPSPTNPNNPSPGGLPYANPADFPPAAIPSLVPGSPPTPTSNPNPFTPGPNPSFPSKVGGSASPTPVPAPVPTPQPIKEPQPDSEKPKPPEEPKKQADQNTDILDAITALNKRIDDLSKFLIPIPARLNETAKKSDLTPAVEAAVCNPEGCLLPPINQANQNAQKAAEQAKDNNNKLNDALDKLDKAAQAADLGLLAIINAKLGPQIPGGISSRLLKVFSGVQKMWDMLQVDRVLNTLTWIGVLHNALMLSNSLGTTLFSVIDTWLDALGFKLTKMDDDGKPEQIDAQEAVNSWTLNFANSLFGAENVAKLTLAWKKANRIYQAVTNGVQTLQNMFDAARSIAEETANNVGKIGNALKKAGTVVENAYEWMNEKVTARSTRQRKFDEFIQGISHAEDILSDIESIGSNVVDFQDGMKELTEARKEFEDAKTDAQKFANDQAEATKLASKAPDKIGLTPQTADE